MKAWLRSPYLTVSSPTVGTYRPTTETPTDETAPISTHFTSTRTLDGRSSRTKSDRTSRRPRAYRRMNLTTAPRSTALIPENRPEATIRVIVLRMSIRKLLVSGVLGRAKLLNWPPFAIASRINTSAVTSTTWSVATPKSTPLPIHMANPKDASAARVIASLTDAPAQTPAGITLVLLEASFMFLAITLGPQY